MRQKRKEMAKGDARRIIPSEPLADGLRHGPFSDEETAAIVKRRTALFSEGLRDKAITRRISEESGTRSPASVERKIVDLLGKEEIEPNPNRRPRRENGIYSGKNDEELLAIAGGLAEKEALTTRKGLREKDCTLYNILKERGLLDRLQLLRKKRKWVSKSDDEILIIARECVRKGADTRSKLDEADPSLYNEVRERKLFGALGLGVKQRWAGMKDEELVAYAKEFCSENGVVSRYDLQKADARLYFTLWKRKLLGETGLSSEKKRSKFRSWRGMADGELLDIARKLISEKGIRTKTEFHKADMGLGHVLAERGLMERLEFKQGYLGEKKRPKKWERMSDGDLEEAGRRFIAENGTGTRAEFFKANRTLFRALLRRRLLGKLEFRSGYRWASMGDEEIVRYAQEFIREKGIRGRTHLEHVNPSFCQTLRKRGLLDRVFAAIEKSKEQTAVQQVIDALREAPSAMKEFGEGK